MNGTIKRPTTCVGLSQDIHNGMLAFVQEVYDRRDFVDITAPPFFADEIDQEWAAFGEEASIFPEGNGAYVDLVFVNGDMIRVSSQRMSTGALMGRLKNLCGHVINVAIGRNENGLVVMDDGSLVNHTRMKIDSPNQIMRLLSSAMDTSIELGKILETAGDESWTTNAASA